MSAWKWVTSICGLFFVGIVGSATGNEGAFPAFRAISIEKHFALALNKSEPMGLSTFEYVIPPHNAFQFKQLSLSAAQFRPCFRWDPWNFVAACRYHDGSGVVGIIEKDVYLFASPRHDRHQMVAATLDIRQPACWPNQKTENSSGSNFSSRGLTNVFQSNRVVKGSRIKCKRSAISNDVRSRLRLADLASVSDGIASYNQRVAN